MSEEQTEKKMRCPRTGCGYEWTPRVEQPVSCPECKVRFTWASRNTFKDDGQKEVVNKTKGMGENNGI